MKAAVLEKYGRMTIKQVKDPQINNDEVLMKIHYASICGSDQHVYKGEFDPRTTLPLIPGHEFAGEIVELGLDVVGFKKGDRVTVDPIIPCGKCEACKRRHFPACNSLKLIGIDIDGGFAEYLGVKPEMLYKVPESVSRENAALIELLAVGFHAAKRAKLNESDNVVIWGAGKVGNAILHAIKTICKGDIIMVDIIDERLNIAKKAFPDVLTVNAAQTDALKKILSLSDGKGVDVAFEAVGHYHEIPGAFNPVRSCIHSIRGGGKVCTLGLSSDPVGILMKELIWKEATIISSRVSHGEFSDAVEALESGNLDPSEMITGIMNLDDADEAFRLLEEEPEKHLKLLLKI